MDWLNFVLGIFTVIAGGGWFVSHRHKKKEDKVDLTNKILQKYQEGVLNVMDGQTKHIQMQIKEEVGKNYRQIETIVDTLSVKVDEINDSVGVIVTFLTGNFTAFKIPERDERGRFVKSKNIESSD